MFHGLSRRTLNALIIGCLLIITVINLSFTTDEDSPLEPLDAPPLADTGWHLWHSNKGVPVYWQATASSSLQISITGEDHYAFRTQVPASEWASHLATQITPIAAPRPAGLALQGPLTGVEMQQAASFIIQKLSLTTPDTPGKETSSCQQAYPAGALWWNRERGAGVAQPAASGSKPAPTREAWASFRENEIKRLRREWLNPVSAIDIAAELAYHQRPEEYFLQLYQALAVSQRTEPEAFAQCLTEANSSAPRSSE